MKTYLGDAVYAEFRDGDLVLTTSDGMRDTNTIVLEPTVLAVLLEFLNVAPRRHVPSPRSLAIAEEAEASDVYTLDDIARWEEWERGAK